MSNTIAQLKLLTKADIHDKTTPKSIDHVVLSNDIDLIIDEVANRGIRIVANVAALSSTDPADGILLYIKGIGFAKALVTGTPADSVTTYASTTSGTLWELQGKTKPLATYSALLNQTGTAAPVATVLGQNSIGAIVWARSAQGVYTGTLSAAFTALKTSLKVFNNVAKDNMYVLLRTSANVITLTSASNAAGTITANDALLTDTLVEIEVYP